MSLPYHWILGVFVAVAGLSSGRGLDPFAATDDPLLSKEAIATREAPPERMFQGQLAGQRTFLLVHDCEVFRVERRDDGGGVRWTRVLEPDFYPMWTACERQSLSADAGTVTAVLGRRAFGAGGCCASGGTYRSVDGLRWKKR
jgi:hypothetical protein